MSKVETAGTLTANVAGITTSVIEAARGRKILLIFKGIPGSGKSTVARKAAEQLAAHFCLTQPVAPVEQDDYFTDDDLEYKYNKLYIGKAIAYCQQKAERLLAVGKYVVVANTFVKNAHIEFYRKLAKKYNAYFQVIHVKGNRSNIHGVPQHVVERMAKQMERYPGEVIYDNTAVDSEVAALKCQGRIQVIWTKEAINKERKEQERKERSLRRQVEKLDERQARDEERAKNRKFRAEIELRLKALGL
jgi:tRNA uridine 5-carbamoylmethylation protein Kti12